MLNRQGSINLTELEASQEAFQDDMYRKYQTPEFSPEQRLADKIREQAEEKAEAVEDASMRRWMHDHMQQEAHVLRHCENSLVERQ